MNDIPTYWVTMYFTGIYKIDIKNTITIVSLADSTIHKFYFSKICLRLRGE